MIRALIVDDEQRGLINLKKLLQTFCANVQVVGTARNIKDAEMLVRKHLPEVIFLDVEMPNGNGFDLLEKIMDLDINIIFVTAYDSYAVEAFNKQAIHYLLKPISPKELVESVDRVTELIALKQNNIPDLPVRIDALKKLERIKVSTPQGFKLLVIDEIAYVQSRGSYSDIFLKDGSKAMVSKNLKVLAELLDAPIFFRVHKRYIINVNEVVNYIQVRGNSGRGGSVELRNNISIPVAIRRKKEFLKLLSG